MDNKMTMLKHPVLIIFITVAMLSSAVAAKMDGPPKKDIEVHHIPNAEPMLEPLSELGNPQSYRVFGKRYYTDKTSKGYHQRGHASWYGTKFHGRRTSSGEPYDMFAMTAANKTLPIPCYVKVTNLENGKHVIVKVNDRGPFHEGRIIDLSYTAAKKLDMLSKGTAYVQVDAIKPYQFVPENFHDDSAKQLFLQLGAFGQQANANDFVEQIRQHVSHPIAVMEVPFHFGALYKVKIGPLVDEVEATIINKQLQKFGLATGILVKL